MAEVDEEVDRISHLPDALLSEILSYLLTKEAVATSILSKRWESVWTKVPVLNFTVNSESVDGFKEFVDKVLICNNSPSLRLFKLYCDLKDDVNVPHHQYQSWIRNIMPRDVVEIDLMRGTLPSGVFSSEKLTELKLTWLSSPRWDRVYLPNLLTLHLNHIGFTDYFSIKDLLMGLPRLEELVIACCRGLEYICVSSSSLKRLTLEMFWLAVEKITIVDVPSLEYLHIDDLSPEYEFGNMPSLTEATLKVRQGLRSGLGRWKGYYIVVRVIAFLAKVSNLVTLSLDFFTITEAIIGDTKLSQMPSFPNLTHLVLTYHSVVHFSWRLLVIEMLQHAPNLISLDYHSTYSTEHKGEDLQWRSALPISLPKYPIPTLEVVNTRLFELVDDDEILLEYLLNNAINLKLFRFNAKGVVEARKRNIIAWLLDSPRTSSACELVISQ